MEAETPTAITEHKLRIQFIHRGTKKKHRLLGLRKNLYPIQNIPFEFGLKIRNIGDQAFPGGKITEFLLRHITSGDMTTSATKKPVIRALNPDEEIELYVDKYTSIHKGPVWVSCIIDPLSTDEIIHTFQYDEEHDCIEQYDEENEWGNSIFIQGEQELLQMRTNTLIVILTAITVLEAVFGLEEMLQAFFGILSQSLFMLAKFIGNFSA